MFNIFIQNKYTKWYQQIITEASNNSPNEYTELHHIIPKSLGGSNNSSNLISLTPRQHFICHWLLTKMVSDKKDIFRMANAFNLMLRARNPYQESRYTITGRKYENARRMCNQNMSGKNSPFYGVPKSDTHKKNMSIGRKKFIESGGTSWNKGIPMKESTKEKLRQIRKQQIISPEQCKKHSETMTGRKWYYYDQTRIFVKDDDPILLTKDWIKGRGKF